MTPNKFRRSLSSPWKLKLFLWSKLPLAALAGLKITEFEEGSSSVSLGYSYLTKNPFRSIYFAAQAMAAELSTGTLAYYHSQFREKKVSMLVTKMHAEYFKKARSRISFRCDITEQLKDRDFLSDQKLKEGSSINLISEGLNDKGEIVARFHFEWSFKYK